MEQGPIKLTRSVVRALLAIVLCTAALAALIARAQGADPEAADSGAGAARHAHHHEAVAAAAGGHRGRHHVMVMAAPGVADVGGGYLGGGVGYEYRLPYLNDAIGVGASATLRPRRPEDRGWEHGVRSGRTQ